MRTGAAAVAAARACVGARFRPQGRSREGGYDCVGVAAAAYGVEAPAGYPLRGGVNLVAMHLAALGLRAVTDVEPGDLLLIAAGPGQGHLGVWTGRSVVQAHAGLRRVVETPGWPERVEGVFRP